MELNVRCTDCMELNVRCTDCMAAATGRCHVPRQAYLYLFSHNTTMWCVCGVEFLLGASIWPDTAWLVTCDCNSQKQVVVLNVDIV